jgi:hypothetical protein
MSSVFSCDKNKGIVYLRYDGWITAEDMMKMMEKSLENLFDLEKRIDEAEKQGTPLPLSQRVLDVIADFTEVKGFTGKRELLFHPDTPHVLKHQSVGELFLVRSTPDIEELVLSSQPGGFNFTKADTVEEAEKIILEKVKPARETSVL